MTPGQVITGSMTILATVTQPHDCAAVGHQGQSTRACQPAWCLDPTAWDHLHKLEGSEFKLKDMAETDMRRPPKGILTSLPEI